MKVCIVGNDYKQQFPLLGYGGIESAFENLCIGTDRYFKEQVKFCAFVPKILNSGYNSNDYNFNIVQTDFIESSKSGVPAIHFGYEVKSTLLRCNKKPDVIWCYSAWSVQALHDLGLPIICTIMDSGGWEDNKFIFSDNVYYKFCSKFIYDLVFKDADKNEFIRKIKSHSFWCHTGVADHEYEFEANKDDYILWVAGLNWGLTNKGLDIFIELAKLRSDKTFVAYGEGNDSLEHYLRGISKNLKNFEYLGPLQRGKEHSGVFKKAKIFAFLTQIPEAFGMTGLEAITKGTPVLGSMKGAVPELYVGGGHCTDSVDEMCSILDTTFNYKEVYEYSQKFHIKHEIEKLIEFSKTII